MPIDLLGEQPTSLLDSKPSRFPECNSLCYRRSTDSVVQSRYYLLAWPPQMRNFESQLVLRFSIIHLILSIFRILVSLDNFRESFSSENFAKNCRRIPNRTTELFGWAFANF